MSNKTPAVIVAQSGTEMLKVLQTAFAEFAISTTNYKKQNPLKNNGFCNQAERFSDPLVIPFIVNKL